MSLLIISITAPTIMSTWNVFEFLVFHSKKLVYLFKHTMALHTNQSPKPVTKSRITHRTATLKGQHNQSKALYRLGVTADEIHRDKALKTLGGTEDTFKQTLTLLTHQPFKSAMLQKLPMDPMHIQDPLESEYTHHSETADTINQSALGRKDSSSFSLTWTHSQNRSHQLQKS